MAYVYEHVRVDKNEVFYVGIGSDEENKFIRAYSKKRRSKFWKDLTKHSNYTVRIVVNNISWEDACKKEKELIKLYGRKDLKTGTLVNLTEGGEGVNGYKHNNQRLELISKNNQGNGNPNAKTCIHFETSLKFGSLKEGCEYFNLSYGNQSCAIRGKYSTAQFYFENEYFERPTKDQISKKLGMLRLGENNHRSKNYKAKK
jgi:hypothetical protein